MDNHRRHRHRHHHILSSFHPSWCFGPSPANDSPKKPTPNDRRSTAAAAHPKPKRLLRFGSVSVSLSSPRVGCMGQIKRIRKPPNPFMSSSSSSSSSTSSSSSSKSVTLMKFTAAPLLRRSASDPPIVVPRMSVAEDMDPPLPVSRRPASDGNLASLWKRRCGGGGIGGENNMGLRIQLPPPPPPLVCAVVF